MPNPPSSIGRYEVVQRLGQGGMGTVYLARDPQLGRTLAIKVLSVESDNDEVRERFAREARSAAVLHHRNIVTVYDVGEQDGQPFIAMEYVNGESVSEMIKRRAPIALGRKVQLIEELCSGLAYAHKLGVIHRDIKPSNLMVTAEGELKILDFGLARLAGMMDQGLTRTGLMIGTPDYMSPEQIEGRTLDQRTDIFSAGVVMYELLTYQKPFTADAPFAVLHKIATTQAPSILEQLPDVDPELERIVTTAMQRDPAARYPQAHMIVRDLQRLYSRLSRDVETVTLARPSSGERPAPPIELSRELIRQEAESERKLEREAAVRRALDLAKASLAEGAFAAALRATSEALAHDPDNALALALRQEVNDAVAAQAQPASPSREASARADQTIFVPAPSPPIAQPEPHDGTMFIPAMAPGPDRATGRPRVRVTVLQCGDASVVNESFDVGDRFEIGREGQDLRAVDLTWSRRHASIEYTDRGYVIRDLGSTGGTYVNGRRVRANATEPLFFGAQIAIGGSILTFAPASDTKLPDLTGVTVADRYLLERLLRASSKGAVYSARQRTLPLRHALKLLSPALLDYPGYRERFRREAEVAIDLHHPHICDVQDYGETTVTRPGKAPIKTAYLCLRLMAGGTLSDRLDARKPIPIADVARWIDNLADALAYAHRRNVVHGDIKPAAIVFDDVDTANPYLTDFAIGQPREGDSSPGVIGTPAYMAPEQWEGAPSTPATDQFGLAALAYYMITGVRPFEGQDNPEIRRRNFEHGPLPADQEARRHNRDGVRSAVARVLARGLALGPDERYPDLKEFSKELIGALTGTILDRDPNAKPRVFLSYRRAGGAGLPLLIVNQLDKQGIDVFLDVQRIDGAVKFPDRLTREMQRSDVFVCLLGPGTLESRWVQHEIELASQQQKPMIPVFHEEYVLPDSTGRAAVDELLSFDGIRLMDQQNLYVEEGIERLAKRIKETHARDRKA